MADKSQKVMSITVKSRDDKLFILDEKLIRECQLFQKMTEATTVDDNAVIPLYEVDSQYFQLWIDFSLLFKDEPDYVRPVGFDDSTRPHENHFGLKFIEKHIPDTIVPAFIEVVNYLEADRLLDFMIYSWLRRQNACQNDDEIRELFMIPDEYSRVTK